MEYLAYLTDSVPIISNTENYIKIVKERAVKRNLINIGNEIVNYGYDASVTKDELISFAEKKIFDVSKSLRSTEFKSIQDVLYKTQSDLEKLAANKGDITGIPTGYYELDKVEEIKKYL